MRWYETETIHYNLRYVYPLRHDVVLFLGILIISSFS